jgi:hypothetical protein
MRKHLLAIESGSTKGKLLMFEQPKDVAGFVRALGAVATKRKKRIDEELGEKTLDELIEEARKIPSLRQALAGMGGGE